MFTLSVRCQGCGQQVPLQSEADLMRLMQLDRVYCKPECADEYAFAVLSDHISDQSRSNVRPESS